ncbi:dephospho-CoA kinase [Exiguobacterium flavidum]|uniref:dephospho-CoA kinase n=1 Tax=Exiguobacterium flavidum TaxID=2184695 RepID=UPI000DF7ACF2|nr:dephospho-CoA kinase [Exiguobacterium flavidum]
MRVGLTGGIATGKSTVSRYLQEKGIPVVDADVVARRVVEPGKPAHADLKSAFPEAFHGEELDRAKLGQLIFHDKDKRELLNNITHPCIRGEILSDAEAAEANGAQLVVLDIPLLLEGNWRELVDQVVVVYCPEETQLERLMKRNGLTRDEALARLKSQMAIEEKRQKADVVLDNSSSLEKLYEEIDRWLKEIS